MDKIVHLDADEVEYLARVFAQAHERGVNVRVVIDGGFKVAAGAGMWTGNMGTYDTLPYLSR